MFEKGWLTRGFCRVMDYLSSAQAEANKADEIEREYYKKTYGIPPREEHVDDFEQKPEQ